MRRILAAAVVLAAVVALSETLRSQEAPLSGLDVPRPNIRMDERIRAGRFEVYGIELGPIEKTLAAARHLVDYRADITVEAIRKAMAAAGR